MWKVASLSAQALRAPLNSLLTAGSHWPGPPTPSYRLKPGSDHHQAEQTVLLTESHPVWMPSIQT